MQDFCMSAKGGKLPVWELPHGSAVIQKGYFVSARYEDVSARE